MSEVVAQTSVRGQLRGAANGILSCYCVYRSLAFFSHEMKVGGVTASIAIGINECLDPQISEHCP